jgi:hypothetical protein
VLTKFVLLDDSIVLSHQLKDLMVPKKYTTAAKHFRSKKNTWRPKASVPCMVRIGTRR